MPRTPRVVILSGMPPSTTESVADLRDAIEERVPEIDLVVAENYADGLERIETAEIAIALHLAGEQLENANDLQWVQGLSAGVDHFPTEELRERGVALTNAAGANANAVAEHAISFMLAFERNLHRAVRQQARSEWGVYPAGELADKTVGIVGLGSIGGRVAELASAFDMTVVGTKRDPSTAPDAVDEVFLPGELDAVLGRADYVVVACPLTEETRGMFTIKEFSTSMDRDAVLINVGRGEVVNQRHLGVAVREGFIGGAALDVFEEEPLPADSPLWNASDVIVTPHAAGATDRTLSRAGALFAENYERYVEGGADALENRVE